jgi:hypothetical protein
MEMKSIFLDAVKPEKIIIKSKKQSNHRPKTQRDSHRKSVGCLFEFGMDKWLQLFEAGISLQ